MPKAAAKHITPTPTADPVVELSRQLLAIEAQNACRQFSNWRHAVENTISFTRLAA
jgi:hypothetical protein